MRDGLAVDLDLSARPSDRKFGSFDLLDAIRFCCNHERGDPNEQSCFHNPDNFCQIVCQLARVLYLGEAAVGYVVAAVRYKGCAVLTQTEYRFSPEAFQAFARSLPAEPNDLDWHRCLASQLFYQLAFVDHHDHFCAGGSDDFFAQECSPQALD